MTAEAEQAASAPAPAPAAQGQTVGVRLIPAGDTDLPVLANFTRVQISPAGVMIDFGFLEPAAIAQLARTAQAGGKMPEAINGRLAARFVLTPDVAAGLRQQLGQAIAGLRPSSR